MYKYVSIVLAGALVVLGGFYLFERHARSGIERELNNKIAKLEGTIKETQTAYSARALEIEDLKASNEDLQKIISGRDEEIAALGEVVLKWKAKYFKIKDASQTVVDNDGGQVEVPADCQTCLKDLRFRVDFEKVQDYLKVSGHTLTNPPYAEVGVTWERELKLSFILAKKDNVYRLYFDSHSPDLVASRLTLKVDPSVFERKWYEKILLNGSLSVGSGVASGIGVGYDILPDFYIGPNIIFNYDGQKMRKLYGVSVGWYVFR